MSNLRQLGLGMMMYVQDYDERYAPSVVGTFRVPATYISGAACTGLPCQTFYVSDGINAGKYYSWMDLLFPYVKNINMFYCPSQPANAYPSYGYSRYINYWTMTAASTIPTPLSMAGIPSPSEIVMFMDDYGYHSNYASPEQNIGSWYGAGGSTDFVPHFQGANFAFADGHAKWFKYDSPIAEASSSNRYWNCNFN